MQDKDQKLIWENYQTKLTEGADARTSDMTEMEKLKLAADAAKRGKGPLADQETQPRQVKQENIRSSDPEAFKLTADDITQAEAKYNGMRMSKFVNKHMDDLQKKQPVVLQGWNIQKHYGEVHSNQSSKIPGESIQDALEGIGGVISVDRAVADEQREGPKRVFIVTDYSTDPQEHARVAAAQGHQARDMARWRHD